MTNLSIQNEVAAGLGECQPQADVIRARIRAYIVDNLLLGTADELDDAASLTGSGIIDSTGTLELVSFLAEDFGIEIVDTDLVPANLDSVDGMVSLVLRKSAQA
jgi:acyl carrier protein